MGDSVNSNTSGSVDAGRRPVRSRQWSVLKRAGNWLAHHGVTPNFISISSMFFALLGAGLMVLSISPEPWPIRLACLGAAVCVQLRLLANVLDGMVAERLAKPSLAGRLFNEWPDRVSDVILLVGFGWLGIDGIGPSLGLIAACSAVMTAYVRELGRAVDAPGVFLGPMAKPQRMAVLTVALLAITIWPTLFDTPLLYGPTGAVGFPDVVLLTITAGCVLTVVRRLLHLHRNAASQGVSDEHQ